MSLVSHRLNPDEQDNGSGEAMIRPEAESNNAWLCPRRSQHNRPSGATCRCLAQGQARGPACANQRISISEGGNGFRIVFNCLHAASQAQWTPLPVPAPPSRSRFWQRLFRPRPTRTRSVCLPSSCLDNRRIADPLISTDALSASPRSREGKSTARRQQSIEDTIGQDQAPTVG
jgi:hypothetical protein